MRRKFMLSRVNCDEELLAAIGSIAAESSYLERYVETMLYQLTKLTRETGQHIIEAGMLGGKLDLLALIGKAKLKSRKKRLKQFSDLMSEIKHANTERSIAIHGLWYPPHENYLRAIHFGEPWPAPAVATKRGKGDGKEVKLEAKRAVKLAEQISDLHWQIHDFAEETWPNLFPPKEPKARKQRSDPKRPRSQTGASTPNTPQSP